MIKKSFTINDLLRIEKPKEKLILRESYILKDLLLV